MRRTVSPLLARLFALAALCAVVALLAAACGGPSERSVEERLDEKGTMDVIEEAAQAEYEPPADGRLTEKQMEMYLEVQERAVEIRRVAKQRMEGRVKKDEAGEGGGADGEETPSLFEALRAVGDLGDVMTADLRAAQDLGHNPAEYQWVQGQILEAQMARAGKEMQQGAAQAGRQFLEVLEAQLDNARDDEQREEIRRQIREYEDNLAEMEADEELEPSVQHNLELFQEYRERIQEAQEKAAEQLG